MERVVNYLLKYYSRELKHIQTRVSSASSKDGMRIIEDEVFDLAQYIYGEREVLSELSYNEIANCIYWAYCQL